MTPDKVEENIKSALVPWMESFGTKQTFDKVITAIDNLHRRVAELESLAYPVAVDVGNEGKRVEEIERIKKEVEAEYKMGGLSDGLYGDYAAEVATRTLTQYHQDMMREVVEKLNLKMASPSPDPYNNEFEEGYDRGIYDAIETLTEAQTIIKSK